MEWSIGGMEGTTKKTDAFHFLPDILNSRYTCVSMYGRERGREKERVERERVREWGERGREKEKVEKNKRGTGAHRKEEKGTWKKIEGERKK
jgi:hypothetical protein